MLMADLRQHDGEGCGRDWQPWLVAQTLVVGGGPAGFAPLVAASKSGRLDAVLARGVVIVERGPTVGGGRIGDYLISSDSAAEAFLSAVIGNPDPRLAVLADHPATRAIEPFRGEAVPLPLVGDFMAMIGAALARIVHASPASRVITGCEVLYSRRDHSGVWRSRLRRLSDGVEADCISRQLVVAAGGRQAEQRLCNEQVIGEPLLPRYQDRVVQSDEVLTAAGLARLANRLADKPQPKVAIVGGSTSAVAVAHALLNRTALDLGPGGVTILHRRPLRVFYPSADAALAEGYSEFGPDDICPISGFVYRLAGFRLDSRELVMRLRGIGGRPAEPRLVSHRLDHESTASSRAVLDAADSIVACLGYAPAALPLHAADGSRIALSCAYDAPLVDGQCRVMDAGGRPVEGVYGIGLAAGFVPRGRLGGEPSFSGQANGLWLWQNDVGALIAEAMLGHFEAARDAGPALCPQTFRFIQADT